VKPTYTTEADLEVPYLASPLQSHELAEVEKARLEKQGNIKGLASEDLDEVVGRYRVEVHLSSERSRDNPFPGIIHTMINSARFGGGGLMPTYACANEMCGGFIHPDNYSPSAVPPRAICSKCGQVWHVRQVFAHRKYKLSNQNWAYAIARTVIRLGLDADVWIIFFSEPLIKPTLDARADPKLGVEPVENSRKAIRKVIYPLGRLLKDLSVEGVELEQRMYAFIMA
jgi:hypothetical protein